MDTEWTVDRVEIKRSADTPCDKRALRAEIDEAAWSALYTNEFIPFENPSNKGRIAVEVIDHHGDEVLKVDEVK